MIELEGPDVLATITLWNEGHVEVIRDRSSDVQPSVIDDRKRSANENVGALLDRYVAAIRNAFAG